MKFLRHPRTIFIIAGVVLLIFSLLLGIAMYRQTTTNIKEPIITSVAVPKPADKEPREVKSIETSDGGELIITYTDGSRQNAGKVRGDDGFSPTAAQIDAALLEYCSSGRCDSKAPTFDQIIAAVSVFCSNGVCKGDRGADAQPITVEQVAAAVDSYCSAGRCVGATGPGGTDGANGTNGTNGEPPVSWKFRYLKTYYTCARTDPFDPASPTYSCDPTPPDPQP